MLTHKLAVELCRTTSYLLHSDQDADGMWQVLTDIAKMAYKDGRASALFHLGLTEDEVLGRYGIALTAEQSDIIADSLEGHCTKALDNENYTLAELLIDALLAIKHESKAEALNGWRLRLQGEEGKT